MRVPLKGHGVVITDQLRTYVEYRLFTGIARHQAMIHAVGVTLKHRRENRLPFLCVVTVELTSGEEIKIRAYGAHPNAAVDRASDRASLRLSRRTSRDVSS